MVTKDVGRVEGVAETRATSLARRLDQVSAQGLVLAVFRPAGSEEAAEGTYSFGGPQP